MSATESLNILLVNKSDCRGGAARVAWQLHRRYREEGHRSWLAVASKGTNDPWVMEIPSGSGACVRLLRRLLGWAGSTPPATARRRSPLGSAGESRRRPPSRHPIRLFNYYAGWEDFHFPASRRLLEMCSPHPDLVHCHNLHSDYFDLRSLPRLSSRVPVFLTLHDAWLLSGHCSHSFSCERWKTGCGACPDLGIYPPLRRDATASNWRRKRRLYQRCRLFVASPADWLISQVRESMLAPALAGCRKIPYGVDLEVFSPGCRKRARRLLNLDPERPILLFSANGIRSNSFKDFATLEEAVLRLRERQRPVLFVGLGEAPPPHQEGASAHVHWVPYVEDATTLALWYQAADIYVHAAHADTFPNSVLEALACGLPVAATAVGGIPEQVRSLTWPGCGQGWEAGEATGVLVPPRQAQDLAGAVEWLLARPRLRVRCSENAVRDARSRFDLRREAAAYLDWYREVLSECPNNEPAT